MRSRIDNYTLFTLRFPSFPSNCWKLNLHKKIQCVWDILLCRQCRRCIFQRKASRPSASKFLRLWKMNSLSGDGGELLVVDRPPDLALLPLRSHVECVGQVREYLPPFLRQFSLRAKRRHHRGVRRYLCALRIANVRHALTVFLCTKDGFKVIWTFRYYFWTERAVNIA